MEQTTIRQTISNVEKHMEKGGYARRTLLQFKSTTNQLLKFMDSEKIEQYSTEVGIQFLKCYYSYDPSEAPSHFNPERLRCLRKLSEFQLHGTIIPKTHRHGCQYTIPEAFCAATEAFLAYRRFEGIVEKNMGTVSLYLERFFNYLTAQSVVRPD